MATRSRSLAWVTLLAALLLTAGASHAADAAQASCGSGAEGALGDSCSAEEPQSSGPEVHVEDGLLTEELRQELIQARTACRACPERRRRRPGPAPSRLLPSRHAFEGSGQPAHDLEGAAGPG